MRRATAPRPAVDAGSGKIEMSKRKKMLTEAQEVEKLCTTAKKKSPAVRFETSNKTCML